jgi:hypothetical protein
VIGTRGETGDNPMMRRLFLVVLLLVPGVASADLLSIFGELQAGGMYGEGTSGAQQSSSFFAKSPHGAYGALVGAELLIFDAWIQHNQFTDGTRITTWTQFGLGLHTRFDTGTPQQQQQHQGGYFDLGAGAWFGLGTGQQVMPPLDNAQVSDKGFLLEARVGGGWHLNSVLDFGLEIPVSWGYFFKNNAPANDTSNQYEGVQGEVLLVLRAHLALL